MSKSLTPQMVAKTFALTLARDGEACFIRLPFDPKAVFGKLRVPVKVTVNDYTYRSTIASMGGVSGIPLRKSHREAAGVDRGDAVRVRVEFDGAPRAVVPPADLLRALKARAGALDRWRALSYTRQREYVEAIAGAKKPETRTRRIAAAMKVLQETRSTVSGAGGRAGRAFVSALPPDRRPHAARVRAAILRRLPAGYEEVVSKEMLVYQVPLAKYADTYNGHPLWYVALASEKAYLSLHLMPVYADTRLAAQLALGFSTAGKTLKMGKACIRFKSADDLALDTIGDIVASVPLERWIAIAQSVRRR